MSANRARPLISLTGSAVAGPLIASRPGFKSRHLLAAFGVALACLALGIALRENQGTAGRSAGAGALAHSYRQEGMLSLPAGAQAPVSAALGEDSPAYRVTAAAGGYRAHNPGQRLALRFTRAGVSVRLRRTQLRLALRDVGYGDRLRPVGASDPTAAANRVSYALGGGVREWYANGPLGLEQGFDIERAPAGGRGPLTLSLALSGNLRPRLVRDGVSLTGHGATLRYAGLVVRDARGRKLHAWLELRRHTVLIRIIDHRARYPLRVDPWFQNAELTATSGEKFGDSVAVSDNTIVVGAPGANDGAGAVYVFTSTTGAWANATPTAELTASNPENGSDAFGGDQLGQSVAIDGSTIVAGAPYWTQYSNSGNIEDEGAVYEWTLPKSGVWTNATQTAILTATNLTDNDYLGASVAIQGSTIVAGAPNHLSETPLGGPGSVYVYTMPTVGGWVNANQTAQLSGYDSDAGDGLGYSVAISGSTIVAGAPEEEWDGTGNYASRGGVYVWTEPPSGVWVNASATAELIPNDAKADDQLGISVAVSGSTIVGGAPGHSIANRAGGTAYVWTLPPIGGWGNATQPAELTSTDLGGGLVGESVAVSGSTIFSGGGYSITTDRGAVYEWTQPASGFWADETQAATLTPTDGAGGDLFGDAMAMSDSTLVVGAFAGNGGAGAAYVFSTACGEVPVESDGPWDFGGCFTKPDSTDNDTTQSSSLEGMAVTPSSPADQVDFSTGGSSGDALNASAPTSLALNMAPVSGGSQGLVTLTKTLNKLNLAGGPVSVPLPSGFKLAGLALSGSISFSPQGGGTAVGKVSGKLPDILGGGPVTVTVTTTFGKGVTSVVGTATSGSLANVFGLSTLKLGYSGGTWTVQATAKGAGGTTQTMSGSLSFNAAGAPTQGSLKIGNVVIAGLLNVKTFEVSYSAQSGWKGAADLSQGSQQASVSFAFSNAGVMKTGSISAKGITLWQVFTLSKFVMTFKAPDEWGLALAVEGSKDAPAVSADLSVKAGTVTGANLEFKRVRMLGQVTIDDLKLGYSTPRGHDDFTGSADVSLPSTAVSKVHGEFEMVDGLLKQARLDLFGNVPLYGALTLNHLGAEIKLMPNKEIIGRFGLSAGPKTDKGSLLGLDGEVSYLFPGSGGGTGTYTFKGNLNALNKTLGEATLTAEDDRVKLTLTLGNGGAGLSLGKRVSVTGTITGGLRGTTFVARGQVAFKLKVGSHTYSADGELAASNAGLRACAQIPALAKGYSGIFYSWDGEIATHIGDCE
jgi:hypothetical protein